MGFDYKAAKEKAKKYTEQQIKTREKGGEFKRPLFDLTDYPDVTFFKLKEGEEHLIDIVPYIISSTKNPLVKAGFQVGADYAFKLDIWTHRNIGPNEDRVLCLKKTYGKACPICEAQQELLEQGMEWKSEEVKALKASRRSVYNIIDLNSEEEYPPIQIFEASHWDFEKELLERVERLGEDSNKIFEIDEGKSIGFYGGKGSFENHVKPKDFQLVDREPYDAEIFEETLPLDSLLIVPTYKEVQDLFLMIEDEDSEPEPPKEETTPPRSGRSRRKPVDSKQEDPPETEPEDPPSEEDEKTIDQMTSGCPAGFIFGSDFDKHDACTDCDEEIYGACGNAKVQSGKKPRGRKKK